MSRRAWGTVASMWTVWLLWGGTTKALGVLLPYLESQFTADAWLLGWIVAMTDGMVDLAGPFASPLGRRFGAVWVAMASGAMVGLAFIAASLVPDVWLFAMVLTPLAGFGLGTALVLTREATAVRFTSNFGLATAIGQTGTSISMILFAPLTQLLLDTYGWRGTMLIVGAMSLHLVASGALLYKAPTVAQAHTESGYKSLPSTGNSASSSPAIAGDRGSGRAALLRSVADQFGLHLLGSPTFWLVDTVVVSLMYPFEQWFVYFVWSCRAKGFRLAEAGFFVMAAGGCNLLGKVAGGGAHLYRGTAAFNLAVLAASALLACASMLLTPFASSYGAVMVAAVAYACASGTCQALSEVLIRDALGPDRLSAAIGLMGLQVGLLRFTLGFVPGWIFDHSGSYDLAFVILGCVHIVGVGPLVWLMRREHKRSK